MKLKIELEAKGIQNEDVRRAVRRVMEKTEYDSLDELIKSFPRDVKIPSPIGKNSFYGDKSFINQIEIDTNTLGVKSFPIVYTGGIWPSYIGKVKIE